MKRKSINATIFISIFLFRTLFFLSQAMAESQTVECNAVDILAEVYYYIDDSLSIGVYGDEDKKYCQFSINGATKTTNQESSGIRLMIRSVYDLRSAFKKKNHSEAKNIMNKIGNNWIYLIAAPNLQNGIPDNLSSVFSKNTGKIANCITDFYLSKSPELSDYDFSCSVFDEKKKVLRIKFSIGSYYELLLFR